MFQKGSISHDLSLPMVTVPENKDNDEHVPLINDKQRKLSYNVFFDYIPALVTTILIALEIAYVSSTFAHKLNSNAIPYSIIDFIKVSWLITALLQFSTEMNWLLLIEYFVIFASNLDLIIYLYGKSWNVKMSYWCRNYSIIILSIPFFMKKNSKRLPVTLLIAIFKALSTSAVFSIFVLVFNGSSSSNSSSTAIYLVSTFSVVIFILQTALLAVANNRLNIGLFVFHLGLLICVLVNFILLEADLKRYDHGKAQLAVYLIQTLLIFVVVFMLMFTKTENHALFQPLWKLLVSDKNK